jgi:hypothetical protein
VAEREAKLSATYNGPFNRLLGHHVVWDGRNIDKVLAHFLAIPTTN